MSQQHGIMTAERNVVQVARTSEKPSRIAELTQSAGAEASSSSELKELWQERHLSLQEKYDRLASYFNNPNHPHLYCDLLVRLSPRIAMVR